RAACRRRRHHHSYPQRLSMVPRRRSIRSLQRRTIAATQTNAANTNSADGRPSSVRILIYSPAFYPSIGGIETLVDILAREFVRQGHAVKLISQVPGDDSTKTFPFPIIRRPGPRELLSLTRWCDVFFQPQMSLKGLWPLLLARKPWVVAHNAWYERADASLGWQDYLKHFCSRFATGISVSEAVAAHVMTPSQVIPNTFREDVFRLMPEVPRNQDLAF